MRNNRRKMGGWRPNAGRKPGTQVQTHKMILERLKRYRDAVAYWRVAWNLRMQGMKYRIIGISLGISEPQAHRLVSNYEEYLLNQKTKKAA